MPRHLRFASRRLAPVVAALLAAAAPAHAEAELSAETVSGNFLAGIYASVSNDVGISAGYFAAALDGAPGDTMLLENAFVLSLAAGDMETAFRYADDLSRLPSRNRQADLALAIQALHEGRYDAVKPHLEDSAVGPLARLLAGIIGAWTDAAAGDFDAGLAGLDSLPGEMDVTFFRAYHRGLMADLAGRHDLAADLLLEAYGMDTGSIRVAEAAMRALVRADRRNEAEALLAEIGGRAPRHPIVLALAAEIAADRPMAAQITSAEAGAAEILTGLGGAVARNDSWQFAAVYLQLALYLDPDADLARVTLGETLDGAGQYEAAIATLSATPADSPLKRSAVVQTSFALSALERYEEAEAVLQTLVDADPADIEAVVALGTVLQAQELDEEAVAAYSGAIDVLGEPQPPQWLLYFYRGATYDRLDRWPEAEADLRVALELRPQNASVLNHLGYSMIDRGENLDEALGMVREAVALEPTDGYIIDSLGWAYYRLGRYDEAVETLETAIELKPADSTINDHLGDAYWMVGRRLEAQFQWNHARDGEPEPEQLEAILAKLRDGLPEPTAVGPDRAEATP
jgi:tetratricopeptide (TPR) repeat protein